MSSKKTCQKISGGKAIIEILKEQNIKYVFGLIGSATMELFDALYDSKEIIFTNKLRRNLVPSSYENANSSYIFIKRMIK